MFRDSSIHKLDPKGRIAIPTRFRTVMDRQNPSGLMFTEIDKHLWLTLIPDEKKLNSVSWILQKKYRHAPLSQGFHRDTQDGLLDSQGRILIHPTLRNKACLEKEITLVGVRDHFEILSSDQWEREHQQLEEDLENDETLRNEIAKLGI